MRYEIIHSSFPDEPPEGSVILGKSGVAWQSYKGGDDTLFWSPTKATPLFHKEYGQKWAYVVIEEAPLQVLYRAGEKDSA